MARKLRRYKMNQLPKLTREHARVVNSLLCHLPQTPFDRGFKERLREVLEPIVHADVDLWLDSVKVLEGGELTQVLSDPFCATVVGLIPRTEKALLEVDNALAQQAIDRLLGGDAADVDVARPLSEIETGVFTYILLKVLQLVQSTFGGERQIGLKLEGVHGDLGALQERFDIEQRLVCLSFKLFFDTTVGLLRLYLPASLVDSDFSSLQPAPGPAQDRLLLSLRDRADMIKLLRTSLSVEVGRLSLPMNDIENLEVEDIILVEQTDVRITPGDDDTPASISGQVQCRVGAGAHGVLIGQVGVGENGRYEVALDSIIPEGEPAAMGFLFAGSDGSHEENVMAEESRRLSASGLIDAVEHAATMRSAAASSLRTRAVVPSSAVRATSDVVVDRASEHSDGYDDDGGDAPSADAAQLLEDVTVAMVVELGRVMVSAADVMGLRPGQVIELARAPGEPVDLVVDGKRIGKGELVEIDGELGVRILSLAR